MSLMSDKKTPDGRSMVAIPVSIEFVAYVEEHEFYEHMTYTQGNLDVLKEIHKETLLDVLDLDNRLSKTQEGWSTVHVERVK